MPELLKFCYCISLRTGGIILGCLSAIFAVITAVISIYSLSNRIDDSTRTVMDVTIGLAVITIHCAVMLLYGASKVSVCPSSRSATGAAPHKMNERKQTGRRIYDFSFARNVDVNLRPPASHGHRATVHHRTILPSYKCWDIGKY